MTTPGSWKIISPAPDTCDILGQRFAQIKWFIGGASRVALEEWVSFPMGTTQVHISPVHRTFDMTVLKSAAADFRYLLNRGYPRTRSLELVGNRYNLDALHRQILHRGVFAAGKSQLRRAHWVNPSAVCGQVLAVDGHNVLITLEAFLSKTPVVLCDDGWFRDVSGASSGYRFGEIGKRSLAMILETLKALGPGNTLFLFDSPMAYSGELASLVREEMKKYALAGDARAVPVPENILQEHEGIVATSDSALIDRLPRVVDLAGHIIGCHAECGEVLNLTLLCTTSSRTFPEDGEGEGGDC